MPENNHGNYNETSQKIDMDRKIDKQLSFLQKADWLQKLQQYSNSELEVLYGEKLTQADSGLGYCMDERPIVNNESSLKPAFVGGAAGWIVLFMMRGQTLEQALENTQQLYEKMRWGKMQVHIDNEHGHIDNPEELIKRTKGCGFLKVWSAVAGDIHRLLKNSVPGLASPEEITAVSGDSIITSVRNMGGTVVPLTGEHRTLSSETSAAVVVNTKKQTTLNRDRLYKESKPAFLWDMWATTEKEVVAAFNSLAGSEAQWTEEEMNRVQTALHLATGIRLNAVDFSRANNFAVI